MERTQTVFLRVPPHCQVYRIEERTQKQIQLLYGNLLYDSYQWKIREFLASWILNQNKFQVDKRFKPKKTRRKECGEERGKTKWGEGREKWEGKAIKALEENMGKKDI